MSNEKIKEKLTFYRTLLTLFWTGIFILGSGISWSFLNLKGTQTIVPVSGVLIEICFILAVVIFIKRIRKLIREL